MEAGNIRITRLRWQMCKDLKPPASSVSLVLLIGAEGLPGKLAVKGGAQRRAEHASAGSALEGELSR